MSEIIKKKYFIDFCKNNFRFIKSGYINKDIFRTRKLKLISEIKSFLSTYRDSKECSINASNLIKIIQSLPEDMFSDKIFFEKNPRQTIRFKKENFLLFVKKIHSLFLRSFFLTNKQKIIFSNIERFLMKLYFA